MDELINGVQAGEVRLTGEGGFLPEMIKAVLERARWLAMDASTPGRPGRGVEGFPPGMTGRPGQTLVLRRRRREELPR